MSINEFKRTSLEFRRIASNMLRPDVSNATINFKRFKYYIDKNKIISEMIRNRIEDVSGDFRKVFDLNETGWRYINPPFDENEHIRVQYDFITYICENNLEIEGVAYNYPSGSNNRKEKIIKFLDLSFKHIVDTINEGLTMEMMLLQPNSNSNNIVQNIDKNYGTINAAGNNTNSVNNVNVEMKQTMNKVIEDLKEIIKEYDVEDNKKDDIIDDLESLEEQLNAEKPKISRLRNSLKKIEIRCKL